MGVVEDLLGMLDRIPIWKRLGQVPAEIDTLKQQMAALEKRMEKVPGETCPACGERSVRRTTTGRTLGSAGSQYRRDVYTCEKCGGEEERIIQF